MIRQRHCTEVLHLCTEVLHLHMRPACLIIIVTVIHKHLALFATARRKAVGPSVMLGTLMNASEATLIAIPV